MPFPVALVGVGKIARDQHLPAIAADPDFELVAAVSRHATVDGVPNWTDFDRFLAEGPTAPSPSAPRPARGPSRRSRRSPPAATCCSKSPPPPPSARSRRSPPPPAPRAPCSSPPGTPASPRRSSAARDWLAGRTIRDVRIVWREDVRHWHPGQDWIWQPGGFGVFDPGINALSILTALMPDPVMVLDATLEVPANRAQPIAAWLGMASGGIPIVAEFDWRQEGPQTWDIAFETDAGRLDLREGGAVMAIDGAEVSRQPEREYPLIYRRFAELLADPPERRRHPAPPHRRRRLPLRPHRHDRPVRGLAAGQTVAG